MDNLSAIFFESPALRIGLALIFYGLLGVWFFRRFAGQGKIVFLGLCLLLAVLFYFLPLLLLFAFVLVVGLLAYDWRRPEAGRPGYRPAETLVEGGGLKRGLTAAEAAVVMERPLNQVLAVVLLGLLTKEILAVAQEEPGRIVGRVLNVSNG